MLASQAIEPHVQYQNDIKITVSVVGLLLHRSFLVHCELETVIHFLLLGISQFFLLLSPRLFALSLLLSHHLLGCCLLTDRRLPNEPTRSRCLLFPAVPYPSFHITWVHRGQSLLKCSCLCVSASSQLTEVKDSSSLLLYRNLCCIPFSPGFRSIISLYMLMT